MQLHEITVALVGDYSPSVLAHKAIPLSLELVGRHHALDLRWAWIPTNSVVRETASMIANFDAVWCVPGSPYENEDGAISAIREARERNIPFLGTCGGCQHAILEYARNVLGLREAGHAETHPKTQVPLITPLFCSLVDKTDTIRLVDDSLIAKLYGMNEISEEYHCSYGLNPKMESVLSKSQMKVTGRDKNGEVRALELHGNRYHLLVQFQPERAALRGSIPVLVDELVRAAFDLKRAV